jgi:hypothetical protein
MTSCKANSNLREKQFEITRLFDSIGRSFIMETTHQSTHSELHEKSFQEYGSTCLSLVFYNEYGLATSLQLVENYLRKVQ